MSLFRNTYFFLLSLCLCTQVWAQSDMEEAMEYFDAERYFEALEFFKRLPDSQQGKDIYLKRIDCLIQTNRLKEAQITLGELLRLRPQDPDYLYWKAKIAHLNDDFLIANKYYKDFLRKTTLSNPLRDQVRSDMIQCTNGYQLRYKKPFAIVENLGKSINTIYDEFGSIQSKNKLNRFYFSSDRRGAIGGLRDKTGAKNKKLGHHFCDMYFVEINDGKWDEVRRTETLLNSPKHDVIIGFNDEGYKLYFYKSLDHYEKEIVVNTHITRRREGEVRHSIRGPIDTKNGDGFVFIVDDQTFVFASDRPGGYGGYDLYITAKRGDKWSEAINLGPDVNSEYDEISPFLTRDKRKLYFSSNRRESVGGFDVFSMEWGAGSKWTVAENLGLPINSSGDDTHFSLTRDGQTALFSSNRKSGFGKFDLYAAYLFVPEKSQIQVSNFAPFFDRSAALDYVDKGEKPTIASHHQTVALSPLFDTQVNFVLDQKQMLLLDNLIHLMNAYPETTLVLEGHSTKDKSTVGNLKHSLNHAKVVADYLVENGVSEKNLLLRGYGNSHPIIANSPVSNQLEQKEEYNNRVEFLLLNIDEQNLSINYLMPKIDRKMMDRNYELFKVNKSGLSYRIECMDESTRKLTDLINQTTFVEMEEELLTKNGKIRFGMFDLYHQANNYRNRLKEKHDFRFKMSVFIDGEEVRGSEIAHYISEYPDLKNYLKFEH